MRNQGFLISRTSHKFFNQTLFNRKKKTKNYLCRADFRSLRAKDELLEFFLYSAIICILWISLSDKERRYERYTGWISQQTLFIAFKLFFETKLGDSLYKICLYPSVWDESGIRGLKNPISCKMRQREKIPSLLFWSFTPRILGVYSPIRFPKKTFKSSVAISKGSAEKLQSIRSASGKSAPYSAQIAFNLDSENAIAQSVTSVLEIFERLFFLALIASSLINWMESRGLPLDCFSK